MNEKNIRATKREHTFKGYTYNIEILNSFNPELELKGTDLLVGLMTQLIGFKFMTTLVLVFKKIESNKKTNFDNFYSSWKAKIIINESDIDVVFQSIYTTIITNIQKSFEKGSGWIIHSTIDYTISISKYNPVAGSSYIKKN